MLPKKIYLISFLEDQSIQPDYFLKMVEESSYVDDIQKFFKTVKSIDWIFCSFNWAIDDRINWANIDENWRNTIRNVQHKMIKSGFKKGQIWLSN